MNDEQKTKEQLIAELAKLREESELVENATSTEISSNNSQPQGKEKYSYIFNNSPVGLLIYDKEGIVTDCNDAHLKMLGSTRDIVIGFNMLTSLKDEKMRKAIAAPLSGEHSYFEGEYVTATGGRSVYLKADLSPIINADNKIVGAIGIVEDITDRKRAEAALKESEERYRNFYLKTPAMLHSIDRLGRLLSVSDLWLSKLGYSRDEVIGRKSTDFLTEESKKYAEEVILPDFFETGRCDNVPYQFIKKNGEIIDILLSATAEKDMEGNVLRSIAILDDVTDKKRAEMAIIESQEKYRYLFDNTLIGVGISDIDCEIKEVNDAMCKIFGYTKEEFLSKDIRFIYADLDDREKLLSLLSKQSKVDNFVIRLKRKNNEIFWANLSIISIEFEGKQAFSTACIDITDQKRAENVQKMLINISEATAVSRDIADLIENIHHQLSNLIVVENFYVAIYDEKSDTYSFPYYKDEHDELDHYDGYTLKNSLTDYVRKTGKPILVDTDLDARLRESGEIILIGEPSPIWMGTPLKTDKGTVGVVVLQSYDNPNLYNEQDLELINSVAGNIALAVERKLAADKLKRREEELKNRNEFIETIMNNQNFGIAVHNTETNEVLYMNQAFEKVYGIKKENLKNLDDFFEQAYPDPDYRREIVDMIVPELLTGDPEKMRWENVPVHHSDGKTTYVTAANIPLPAQNMMISTAHDVTERVIAEQERRKFEEKFQQTQKLESLGILAGGIAHDFNNILMGILGNASMALMDLPENSPAQENLKNIELSAQRAADLTSQMLAYAGKGRFVIQPINVSKLINEIMHLIKASISKKAEIKLNMNEDIPFIKGDVNQIRQIIINLMTNASEALKDGEGIICVNSGVMKVDEDFDRTSFIGVDELIDQDYVYFEINDNGCGMDEDTKARIFDPFFSTKFTGRGLGLAAVVGIVRGHNGAIKVQSALKQGTTFTVIIPVTEFDAVKGAFDAKKDHSDSWKGSGVILLVDDEESVRKIAKRMLEKLGFSIILASEGNQAVEIFLDRKDEIDWIILDMKMLRMDGPQAFREILKLDADAKIILSSGYTESEAASIFEGEKPAAFLQKPYNLSKLQDKFKNLLKKNV